MGFDSSTHKYNNHNQDTEHLYLPPKFLAPLQLSLLPSSNHWSASCHCRLVLLFLELSFLCLFMALDISSNNISHSLKQQQWQYTQNWSYPLSRTPRNWWELHLFFTCSRCGWAGRWEARGASRLIQPLLRAEWLVGVIWLPGRLKSPSPVLHSGCLCPHL